VTWTSAHMAVLTQLVHSHAAAPVDILSMVPTAKVRK